MTRALLEFLVIFAIPFVLFWLFRRIVPASDTADDANARRNMLLLALSGLLLVAAYLVISRVMEDRHTGSYSPARVENGVLIPGRVE